MTSMIFKVDPEPGTDRYMIWSTVIDGPTRFGTRDDMIAWLQQPIGDDSPAQARRVMRRVDDTGTSDRAGRGGWDDVDPIPVGDMSPGDGWYQIGRRDLPALADAIEARDTDAAQRLFVRYA